MLPRGIPWGLERNFGIKLQAICATASETFASVFVPEDDVDAQYHLMGRGLNLSCPVERYCTAAVRESDQVEAALVAERPAKLAVASVNPKTPEVATVDKRGFHVFTAYRCAKLQLQDWAPPILKIQPPASTTSFKFSSHRAELSVSSELTFGRAAINRWVSSSLLPTRLPITAPENIVSF
jgi:hypothetical protein